MKIAQQHNVNPVSKLISKQSSRIHPRTASPAPRPPRVTRLNNAWQSFTLTGCVEHCVSTLISKLSCSFHS